MTATSDTCRIALVQMAMSADAADNLARALQRIEAAAKAGAALVCLPELFRTPYFCQREDTRAFDCAEPVPGPTTEAMCAAAKRHGIVVIAPVFERRAPGVCFNSAAVIDADGAIAGVYRKMHIPDDPSYYEKYYFTPGDRGFMACTTRAGRVAPLICWDQWFPEAARIAALDGATLLLYPTAIGWHPREKAEFGAAQRDAWQTVQRGHAIANGVYLAAVNRVGHEVPPHGGDGIEFWGSSFIADPQGVVIAQASVDKEEILYGDLSMAHLEDIRRNWPFLRDRRIDAYHGILKRFAEHTTE